MIKTEVSIGKTYLAKVSGKLCRVRLDRERNFPATGLAYGSRRKAIGGWFATNLETGREIVIRTAAKLRGEFLPKQEKKPDIVWLVFKNGAYIGETVAPANEDVARAAALSQYSFRTEDDLSVSEK